MSTSDLIKLVAEENHVKFRSSLNDVLYTKLAEQIAEKTTEMISELFDGEIMEAKKEKPDFLDMDKDGNTEESMKKALKDKEDDGEEEEEEEDEDEDDDEDEDEKPRKKMNEAKKDKEEDEDEEEEDEDEEEEEEDEEEEVMKKGGKSFHFDINSHNEKNGKNKKDKKK